MTVNHAFAVAGETTVVVTATDKDGGTSTPFSLVVNVIQPLTLGGGVGQVSLNGNGVLPFAILTTANFDVRNLDLATLRLSGATAVDQAFRDVDGDGDLDLVLDFRRQDFVDEYAAALVADLVPVGIHDLP